MLSRPRRGAAAAVPSLVLSVVSACATGIPSDPDPAPASAPEVRAVRYYDKAGTAIGDDVAASSLAFVRAAPELTGRGDDWKVRDAGVGLDGRHHVRMQQLHDGLPVVGGDIVVHADAAQFSMVSGTVVRDLADVDVTPSITADAALALARSDYAGNAKTPGATLAYAREATELVVYARSGRDARTAWHVTFFTELQAGMAPGLWSYYVDAATGEILHHLNTIHGAVEQASGPGGNARVPRTWTSALDVVPYMGDIYVAKTPRLQTYSMENRTDGAQYLVQGSLTAFGDAAANDAHGFAEIALDMMRDWYGFDSFDEHGSIVNIRTHYGASYENAFWDGAQLTFGDGGATFYPLSGAIDVVAHELNHAFTSYHSNLVYEGEPGGLNESISDIAGTIAEFYAKGTAADWDVGRDIFRSANTAIRYMCNPTADGASIDTYANYAGQDPHLTSGIPNKAFCRAAKRLASGDPDGTATPASVRRAGEAYMLANASYWTYYTDFRSACQGVMDAATALGFADVERNALRQSWVDVGVYCDGEVAPVHCDETFTAETGTVSSPNYPAAYPDNYFHTWCIQPASGLPATLTFDAFDLEDGYDLLQTEDATGALFTTTGTAAPPPVSSTLVVIRFLSDGSLAAGGWHASWEAGAVPNLPPTVTITSPAAGAHLSGAVTVAAKAIDLDGTVSKVRFELPDGTAVEDTAAPYEVDWSTAGVADGAGYTIRAIASDDLGAAGPPAVITVDVDNAVACAAGTVSASGLPIAIPDNNATGVTSTIVATGAGKVGAMTLSLHVTHPWRDDLRVTLTSPGGTEVVLADRTGGDADDLVFTDLDLPGFVGAGLAGAWRLRVMDLGGSDVGTLDAWSLAFTGNCDVPQPWSGSATPNLALVDHGTACSTLSVTAGNGDAGAVKLDLAGNHDYVWVLSGTLSHGGVTVEAFPLHSWGYNSSWQAFGFTDRAIAGFSGDAAGDWTLCVTDADAYNDTGVLASWSVHD